MGNCFDTSEGDAIPRYEPVDATPLKDSQALMIFVLGGPGVGKSTLCKKLAPKYGLFLIPVSQILRDEVATGSERGRYFEQIMRKGSNVPADIIVQLVIREMLKKQNAYGYLIIGFPRDKNQVIICQPTAGLIW